MSTFQAFQPGQIESLAKVLGDCGSGTDITRVLGEIGLTDNSLESTKWRRLYKIFLECQRQHGCANQVIAFIQTFLTPARFIGRQEDFERHRQQLNAVLSFSGLDYGKDGQFRQGATAVTLGQAEERLRALQSKLQNRRIHSEVLKYCKSELLHDNYFHAVFEAAKGLAQRIRDLSGIQLDNAALVDQVFTSERPILAINTLQTETERSEHKGFASLLKGCFAAVRNPLAHEPKILWQGEDDAADYLSLISLLHRKLDDCVKTGWGVN